MLAQQLGAYRAEVHGIILFFPSNTAKPRLPKPVATPAARPAQQHVEQEEEPSPPVPSGAGNARQRRAAKRSAAKHLAARSRLQNILHKAMRAARWHRMQDVWMAWMSAEKALVVAAGGLSCPSAVAVGERLFGCHRLRGAGKVRGVPGYPEPPPASAAATALIELRAAHAKRSMDKRSPDKGQKDGETSAGEPGATRALKPRKLESG